MPDHLHMLVRLGSAEPLSRLMQRIKAVTAAAANKSHGNGGGAVWMPGYHDHGLRREEDIPAIARYIVANPVRAGLVDRVGSYPYWDAIWLEPVAPVATAVAPTERKCRVRPRTGPGDMLGRSKEELATPVAPTERDDRG